MKKYARNKTHAEILEAAKAAGLVVSTDNHDAGSDWITIYGTFDGEDLEFILSTWNGQFIGKMEDGTMFSERSDSLDGTGWYDAILDFIYVPVDASAA